MKITIEQARRVQEVVDAGLSKYVGEPVPGQMCVEAAVCYALGEPHTDRPSCVSAAVRDFKIRLNDHANWTGSADRAAGLRRIAVAQLGSAGTVNGDAFGRAVFEKVKNWTIWCSIAERDGFVSNRDKFHDWYEAANLIASRCMRAHKHRECIEAGIEVLRELGCPGAKLLDELEGK